MTIQPWKLGLAAALSIACASSNGSRRASPASSGTASAGATSGTSQPGTSGTATSGTATGTTTDSSGASGSPASSGTVSQGSTAETTQPGTSSPGSTGTMSGSTTSGAMAQGGASDVKGHPSDQVVEGKVQEVGTSSITIGSDDGTQKRLSLSEATLFEVDGREAKASDLQEGQEVRASFDEVDGRDVAVRVQAGSSAGSSSSSMGTGSSSSSDAPGTGSSSTQSGSMDSSQKDMNTGSSSTPTR